MMPPVLLRLMGTGSFASGQSMEVELTLYLARSPTQKLFQIHSFNSAPFMLEPAGGLCQTPAGRLPLPSFKYITHAFPICRRFDRQATARDCLRALFNAGSRMPISTAM